MVIVLMYTPYNKAPKSKKRKQQQQIPKPLRNEYTRRKKKLSQNQLMNTIYSHHIYEYLQKERIYTIILQTLHISKYLEEDIGSKTFIILAKCLLPLSCTNCICTSLLLCPYEYIEYGYMKKDYKIVNTDIGKNTNDLFFLLFVLRFNRPTKNTCVMNFMQNHVRLIIA